jgi:hypothetical protein
VCLWARDVLFGAVCSRFPVPCSNPGWHRVACLSLSLSPAVVVASDRATINNASVSAAPNEPTQCYAQSVLLCYVSVTFSLRLTLFGDAFTPVTTPHLHSLSHLHFHTCSHSHHIDVKSGAKFSPSHSALCMKSISMPVRLSSHIARVCTRDIHIHTCSPRAYHILPQLIISNNITQQAHTHFISGSFRIRFLSLRPT